MSECCQLPTFCEALDKPPKKVVLMKENSLNMSDRAQRLARRAVNRGNAKQVNQENAPIQNLPRGKRSVSDMSPGKPVVTRKRTAFGDLTNAIQAHSDRIALGRKKAGKKETISIAKTRGRRSLTDKSLPTDKHPNNQPKVEILDNILTSDLICFDRENSTLCNTTKDGQTFNESNLLNDSTMSMKSYDKDSCKPRPVPQIPLEILEASMSSSDNVKRKPDDLKPYDTDQDIFVVSEYAESVFRNMRRREIKFPVYDYLSKPLSETTGPMRAILVDWLVEVQENFELYHETLYLAIKITDNYLQNHTTPKEQLQLVGATSLLIACKIEERHPPPLDDFQFICDDAYTHKQFVQMEVRILRALDFDINLPHPYRFLRRFARVTSMSMQTLTLARYLLELSLHEARFVDKLPSKMAASCLLLSLKMKNECCWDVNLQYHTGYSEDELSDLIINLNKMVQDAPSSKLQTVRTKYSHQIFYEVAKIPAVDPLLL